MSKGNFSNEVSGTTSGGLPAAPSIVGKPLVQGTQATLVFNLPTVTEDGEAIPAGGYSSLHVYADAKSFLGRIDELLGMEPQTKVPGVTVGQQNVSAVIAGLKPNTKYYFVACVE